MTDTTQKMPLHEQIVHRGKVLAYEEQASRQERADAWQIQKERNRYVHAGQTVMLSQPYKFSVLKNNHPSTSLWANPDGIIPRGTALVCTKVHPDGCIDVDIEGSERIIGPTMFEVYDFGGVTLTANMIERMAEPDTQEDRLCHAATVVFTARGGSGREIVYGTADFARIAANNGVTPEELHEFMLERARLRAEQRKEREKVTAPTLKAKKTVQHKGGKTSVTFDAQELHAWLKDIKDAIETGTNSRSEYAENALEALGKLAEEPFY